MERICKYDSCRISWEHTDRGQGQRKYCPKHSVTVRTAKNKAYDEKYQLKRRLKRREENQGGGKCVICNIDISMMNLNARYCGVCIVIRTRNIANTKRQEVRIRKIQKAFRTVSKTIRGVTYYQSKELNRTSTSI